MLAAFLTTILFAISGVCGHRSARLIGGTEANFWRLACAALMLGAWSMSFGTGLEGAALPWFLLSGLTGVGLGDLAMFQALPRLGSRLSLLLIECLGPPVAAIFEWLWMGTKLTPWQATCGLVIFVGVGIALRPARDEPRRPGWVVGSLFGVLSAIATAVGAVVSRKAFAVAEAAGHPPGGVDAAFQRVLAGLLLAGFGLLAVKAHPRRSSPGAPRAGDAAAKWRAVGPWIFMNSLAGQTLGVSCMQWALRSTPTGVVLSIIATTPVLVIPLAVVFEKERPTAASYVGGLIAVLGVAGLCLGHT